MRLIAIFIALIATFSFAGSVSALTISPVKIEVAGDPGQTLGGEIELYNEQAEPKIFYSSYENFEPSGEGGAPRFVGSGRGLATWMQTAESITLAPQEKKVIPYSITIPSDAEAGGYFSAIFFGGQPPSSQGGGDVAVGGKLGTLVLLRVNGDIDEQGGVLDFGASSRFHVELPIFFSYRMNNEGGDRIVPLGDIVVTNTFGMTAATLSANTFEGSVLPGSARRFETAWVSDSSSTSTGFFGRVQSQWNDLHVGWYTAHAEIVWGADNNVSKARYDFFIIPWQLLSVTFVLCVAALFALKRYNKWVIRNSAKGGA